VNNDRPALGEQRRQELVFGVGKQGVRWLLRRLVDPPLVLTLAELGSIDDLQIVVGTAGQHLVQLPADLSRIRSDLTQLVEAVVLLRRLNVDQPVPRAIGIAVLQGQPQRMQAIPRRLEPVVPKVPGGRAVDGEAMIDRPLEVALVDHQGRLPNAVRGLVDPAALGPDTDEDSEVIFRSGDAGVLVCVQDVDLLPVLPEA
jgi:hypothetical protein